MTTQNRLEKDNSSSGDEHRQRRLAPESDGLEPVFVGRHIVLGCEADINGPDAEIVEFEPTRGELKTLAYHYLSRFFTVEGLGQSGSFEIRESSKRQKDSDGTNPRKAV